MIRTSTGLAVQPGDIAAVRTSSAVSKFIRAGEELALMISKRHRLTKRELGSWEHAIFFAGGDRDLILEAEPGGARLIPFHYAPEDVVWSTGHKTLDLTPEQRARAMPVAEKYKGTRYSFLDYDAIALHTLGVDTDWLRAYISSTGHMICSQLADQCRRDLGSNLFPDHWPGYVDPLDIALLIERSP